MPGTVRATVVLKAAKPDTPVQLRLSWWQRLQRQDTTRETTIGTAWTKVHIETEAHQGGPVELAIRKMGTQNRIWADDVHLETEPPPDQYVETLISDGAEASRRVRIIDPPPIDLSKRQTYEGSGAETPAPTRVKLAVNIPDSGLSLPFVSGGIPFARGTVFHRDHIRVTDGNGGPLAVQADVLARWHADQSIKMLLLTIPRPGADVTYWLEVNDAGRPRPIDAPMMVEEDDSGGITVATGCLTARFAAGEAGPILGTVQVSGPRGTVAGEHEVSPRMCRASIELAGPLRTVIAVRGRLAGSNDTDAGRWVTRCTFWRGSPIVRVSHCWINDTETAFLPVTDASFDIRSGDTSRGATLVIADPPGTEAPVSAAPPGPEEGCVDALAVRDFRWNHPLGLAADVQGYRILLWSSELRGLRFPQGISRQIEVLINISGTRWKTPFTTDRLPMLHVSPVWMCASGVFEHLLPPDPGTFPIFEGRIGKLPTLGRYSPERKMTSRLHGLFNYGDAPGDDGWSNLESMAAHELFLHWIRTADRQHADMARLAAEHYRDVDIHHGAGFCHTHCNNHVYSGESWSHAWIQGVRDLYFLCW